MFLTLIILRNIYLALNIRMILQKDYVTLKTRVMTAENSLFFILYIKYTKTSYRQMYNNFALLRGQHLTGC